MTDELLALSLSSPVLLGILLYNESESLELGQSSARRLHATEAMNPCSAPGTQRDTKKLHVCICSHDSHDLRGRFQNKKTFVLHRLCLNPNQQRQHALKMNNKCFLCDLILFSGSVKLHSQWPLPMKSRHKCALQASTFKNPAFTCGYTISTTIFFEKEHTKCATISIIPNGN